MNSYPPEGGIPLDDSRRIIEEGEPAVPQEIPFWLTSRNMEQARACSDGCARWVEICFCYLPLQRGTTLLGRVF